MNNNQQADPLGQAREIWGTISNKRWGILLTSAVLIAIAVVVIVILPDTYSASTTVLYDPQRLPEKYVAPTVMLDPAQRLNTLTQEVLSAERLKQISRQLNLYPELGQSSTGIVEKMRKGITIDMKPTPGHDMTAFGITYSDRDPQMAAAVANRLAQGFIEWDSANRAQQAASTATFMGAQLQDAKQSLDNEEDQLQSYKQKYSGQLPEQLQSNMQTLTMLHAALQSNSEALNRLEQEKAILSSVPPESTHMTSSNPSERDRLETERRRLEAELANLRAQYTDQFPDVITTRERLEAVTKQLSQNAAPKTSDQPSSTVARLQVIERETERLQAERKTLTQKADRYQAEIDSTPLRSQEFETLNRNYTTARDQYEGLLDKKLQADMALDLEREQKSSRFTVDPAQVPVKPTKPNRLLLFAMAIPFCGLLPACVVVATAELRGTVNSERALRSLLPSAARIVGRIPMIETPNGIRQQRRLAMLSVLGSMLCTAAVAAFLWGGAAARMKKNHAHQFNQSNPNPSAQLLSQ